MRPLTIALLAGFAGSFLWAQQPKLQNAQLQTRPVSGSLDATFKAIVASQTTPAWIGYAAPQIPGDRQLCCTNTINGLAYYGCALEGNVTNPTFTPPDTVRLEGASEFFVFFRVENKQVQKVRSFSIDCNVDGGGLPFIWLTGVAPAQSVALLESLVPGAERRVVNGSISAIGMHRDPSADAALDRLVAPSQEEQTRREATLWLGNSRGRHGYEALVRIVKEDQSERIREAAVTGLAQSKEAEAIPTIVSVARDDKAPKVRQQALFWLAQKAERQISEDAIRRAIDQDPEVQVKKRAVFALTQIKNGDGVPMLIDIARNNKNPAVRKEAMHWLGQSKDPRAVKFFEDVLK
jgi:hypothetical protein